MNDKEMKSSCCRVNTDQQLTTNEPDRLQVLVPAMGKSKQNQAGQIHFLIGLTLPLIILCMKYEFNVCE